MLKRLIMGIALLTLIFVVACSSPASTQTPTSNPPVTSSTTQPDSSPPPAADATLIPKLNPSPKPSGPITATWIDPIINDDVLLIPLDQIEKNWNTHFKAGNMNFMAYIYDGEIQVRANVCPPCRSIGFTLSDDELVCDRCATTFESKTGAGIQGACVDFPKATVKYEIEDGNLVMTEADLVAAYEETITQG